MPSIVHRAAIVLTMIGAVSYQTAGVAPALGAIDLAATSASPSVEFVIEAFPHRTADVYFVDSWGARRSGGRRHRGTDIHSPKGTAIVAVADGLVIHRDWNRLSGWNIKIQHRDGWISAYVHLNNDTLGTDDGDGGPERAFAAGLDVGDFVMAGQVIGSVGDSGNAEHTVAHTHFELRFGEEKVNPHPYLVAAWERQLSVFAKGTALD